MHLIMNVIKRVRAHRSMGALFVFALLASSGPALAEIVWNGDFSDGNFLQYHSEGNPSEVHMWFVPSYGRPIQYGGQHSLHVGNGDLLSLVAKTARSVNGIQYPAGPTRGASDYAAKFTIKNSANGSEPADCDPAGDHCHLRRSQLQQNRNWNVDYNALPAKTERYISFSVHVPANFDASGGGFGPVLWGSKAYGGQSAGWAGLWLSNEGWTFFHRPSTTIDLVPDWWHTMEYRHDRPSSTYWPQGLVDFPNEAASKAALSNVNRGGWTDFIIHFKSDNTLPVENNTGFLDVYMRANDQPWVHVLKIRPMKDISLGGSQDRYDRVIARDAPWGFTSSIGLYMAKERVWNNPHNMVVHFANFKVGDRSATFEDMSPDTSVPETDIDAPPKPPVLPNVD